MKQHPEKQFWQDRPYEPLFEKDFDVAIFGGGYAGFAAATEARQAGYRVLMIDARGDLVWESGRALFAETGESNHKSWAKWQEQLAAHGSLANGFIEGGAAEVLATRQLIELGVDFLYYASPVAVERADGRVTSVIVATRSGLRRICAGQWIDATESAQLLRLIDPDQEVRKPVAHCLTMGLQRTDWENLAGVESLEVRPGLTAEERLLVVQKSDDPVEASQWLLDGVSKLSEALGEQASSTHMSHCSFEPMPLYEECALKEASGAGVINASPAATGGAVNTLAERFALGVAAVGKLMPREEMGDLQVDRDQPMPEIQPTQRLSGAVVVAGMGTGGVVAAIAAGRAAKDAGVGPVLGIEPLALPGGIGTVGGIHCYYFGVQGGLQREIDDRMYKLMEEGGEMFRVGAFSPWAKRVVLGQMLAEAGVDAHYGLTIFSAETDEATGRITSALAVGPDGVVQINGDSWIDGTADAVLTILGGGETTFGRSGDGQPSAYSQSAGVMGTDSKGGPRALTTNYDAGWCDPMDAEDLTRARLAGVLQYYPQVAEQKNRLLYITPAIGLRQGPMAVTDYTLTMNDSIFATRFEDCIGYFACWMDTHNDDLFFDDPEAVLWSWVLSQLRTPMASEIPYRILLPVGLSNVWIASRAFGVTQNVHYGARMQRDMQRIGEATGFAAVLAASKGCGSREVPMAELRQKLQSTGSFDLRLEENHKKFGQNPSMELFEPGRAKPTLEEALAQLDTGKPIPEMVMLNSDDAEVRAAVETRLQADDLEVRWLAAGFAAQWGSPAAEPVLLEVLKKPLDFEIQKVLTALALLRLCGTLKAVSVLDGFSKEPARLSVDVRILLAMIVEQLANRFDPMPTEDRATVLAILERLRQTPVSGAFYSNTHLIFQNARAFLENSVTGSLSIGRAKDSAREDHTWQLDLSVGRALLALDEELPVEFVVHERDARVIVRRAIGNLRETARVASAI